jgi:hypothetical protein
VYLATASQDSRSASSWPIVCHLSTGKIKQEESISITSTSNRFSKIQGRKVKCLMQVCDWHTLVAIEVTRSTWSTWHHGSTIEVTGSTWSDLAPWFHHDHELCNHPTLCPSISFRFAHNTGCYTSQDGCLHRPSTCRSAINVCYLHEQSKC